MAFILLSPFLFTAAFKPAKQACLNQIQLVPISASYFHLNV